MNATFASLTQARERRDRLANSVKSEIDEIHPYPEEVVERICCAGEGWRDQVKKLTESLLDERKTDGICLLRDLSNAVEWIHAEERRQVAQSIPQPKPEASV